MSQNSELEDRERLERFLEWRRADDDSRKTTRRHTAGMMTLSVAVAALITAGAWYAIDAHRRAALTASATPDARVALAPGVATSPKGVSPAPLRPLSRSESKRGDSDLAASSAPARVEDSTPAETTSVETTGAAATLPPAEATISLPPRPRATARLESPPPRRTARVVREAASVPTARTTPDVSASRPPEPASIVATPAAPSPPAVVPDTPRVTVAPRNAESVRSEPSTLPDTPRATVPPANIDSARSEPSTRVTAPPIIAAPSTRTDDAMVAVSRPTPQTGSIPADAAASVAEPPARLAPPAPAPPSTTERLKEWAGYIPEVRLARAIYRWAKKQPPPDGTRPEEPPSPEAR